LYDGREGRGCNAANAAATGETTDDGIPLFRELTALCLFAAMNLFVAMSFLVAM